MKRLYDKPTARIHRMCVDCNQYWQGSYHQGQWHWGSAKESINEEDIEDIKEE